MVAWWWIPVTWFLTEVVMLIVAALCYAARR